uniref:Uncharacterized protein n=1 Tax=Odontella aurita TaxID=265563 RepID=A0A6U6FCR3_9STRA|mmetsp:Transcript_33544/g.99970  ORF Transcript_33544/g.99970 Transcript_33544/m.99970 type:complete len:182 (+) Transcript_33544:188-733(+)
MSTRRVDSSGVHSSTTLAENKISALRDRAALPPSFTPHEEEAEWGSVTPAEMLEIESDLRGLSVDGSAPSSKSSSPGMYDDGVLGGVGGVVGDFGSLLAGPQGTESGPQISTSLTEEERETAMLPALEVEIAAIPPSEKDVYVKATRKCPDLVDDEHKKAFLFKEGFDAKLAARRLTIHWQ